MTRRRGWGCSCPVSQHGFRDAHHCARGSVRQPPRTCRSGGPLDSPRDAMALAARSSGADPPRRNHRALQTMRTSTPSVFGSDRVRTDGKTARGALRTLADGKCIALSGVWAAVAVMWTVERQSDPERGSRDRHRAVGEALAAMAPLVASSARYRRRVVAYGASRPDPRTATPLRPRPGCPQTRHER